MRRISRACWRRTALRSSVAPRAGIPPTPSGARCVTHVVRSRTLRTTGIGESHIADLVGTITDGVGDVGLAYLPNADGTDLRLTVRGATPENADVRLAAAAQRLRTVVGDFVYGEDG